MGCTSSHEQEPCAPLALELVGGTELLRCRVTDRVKLLVLKGDLTASNADAIVNAANSRLMHGGGLAGAIVRNGGSVIQDLCSDWIRCHGPLAVGSAMFTTSGKLPCKFVIHTVGPNISRVPEPTPEHAQQLRDAVWNALKIATNLGLRSVVIPGISTGIFGYPREMGAREIVSECVRFCREREFSTIQVIALMNFDDPTVACFVKAVEDAAQIGAGVYVGLKTETQPRICWCHRLLPDRDVEAFQPTASIQLVQSSDSGRRLPRPLPASTLGRDQHLQ